MSSSSTPSLRRPGDDSELALTALRACTGAVHRLAWEGPDEHGDRERALRWTRNAAVSLARTHRTLAAVLDWWLVAALEQDPAGLAWSIDRELTGRVGETLRSILDASGRKLDVVRRPARLAETLTELEVACQRNPGKIAADKQILSDAIGECRQVLRAAEQGRAFPSGLRLHHASDDELEEWATEGESGRRVVPGTPVWTALVGHLQQRRDLVAAAEEDWPRSDQSVPELPDDWRRAVEHACPEGADIACTLVGDATEDPGPRPLLEPTVRAQAPTERDVVFWLVLSREAGALPDWARPLAGRIETLRERVEARRGAYTGDAADALQLAEEALGDMDPGEAETWLSQADELHHEATQEASQDKVRARAERRAAQLRELGHEVGEAGADTEAWAERVDTRWSEVRQALVSQAREVGRKARVMRQDTTRVEDALEEVRRCLGRGELQEGAAALEAADQALTRVRAAEEERFGAPLWAAVEAVPGPGVYTAAERVLARQERGLSVDALIEDLQALADAAGQAATIVHEGRAVARLDVAAFEALFGRLDVGEGRWLVPHPPSLDTLLSVGAIAVDRLDDARAADWLAREVQGAPEPGAVRAWLETQRRRDDLPPGVREARLARLEELVLRAEALASVRDEALAAWLASDEGERARERATEARVQRESEEVRRRIAELEARRQEVLEEARAAEAEAERRTAEIQARVAAVQELLADEKLRLLGELGLLGGATASSHTPPRATPPDQPVAPSSEAAVTPITAGTFSAAGPTRLSELVPLVAGDTWEPHEVANLLLSLGTGRWTLLAGLPGVGKSTFVRSVLTRLGHGPSTERYLELVVRRDWQDDAALFGFWHPTEGRWMPSSEGFVEHLLRASSAGPGGCWPVVIEELNLASPEYYLARMLSAFEAADPTVRLYDRDLSPSNAARYPGQVAVPSSVRVLGTVNVDDTVERLSPRFLSRASVLWMEPTLDPPRWRAADDDTDLSVPFDVLTTTEEGELGPILELVRLLQDQRVPGAPTARTRRAIARYLAASRGVLPTDLAQDLQILQRILPPLRGVGPRWRRLLDKMVELLEQHGWTRSAARTQELRERGEELGDWYDFFHA